MANKSGSYNGLAFGTGTQYPVTELSGWWDMPPIRSRDFQFSNNDGDVSAPDLVAARIVRMKLGMQGSSPTDLENLRNTIRQTFNRGASSTALIVNDKLVYAKSRRRDIEDDLSLNWRLGEVALEFYCPDPLIYDATEQTQTTGLPSGTGGITFPLTFDITFTAGATEGQIAAQNNGNTDTPAHFIFSGGQMTNLSVTHLETNRTLKMNLVVQAGETLEIDTREHTVMLNGTASRRSYLATAQWFDLQPGINTLKFAADSSTLSPQMQVKWRSAWI